MLSVKNLQNTFKSATESTGIEFVYEYQIGLSCASLACNGEVMMSTIKQMDHEDVFLSSLGRCWKGFNIFENDPLQYQLYIYEQCKAVVVQCCEKYLIVGLANDIVPVGKIKAKLFFLRDFLEKELKKLNCS